MEKSQRYKRPDPDALLAQLKAQEEPAQGKLRIWLGAAPGVGTTNAMLQEGLRRKSRGTDVVVGFVDPRGRADLEEMLGQLEVVPPREVRAGGSVVREMDTDAVIARQPKVVLVDELAHTNAPGSKHAKRYQDVEDLLASGITVVTTLNVQNIGSLARRVEQMTGVTITETIPDSFLDRCDQIELIDMMPDVLIQRVREGKVCPPQEISRMLAGYYTPANLTAMRDLALRVTAREVEERLATQPTDRRAGLAALGDRVLVAVDHRPLARALIRRGWRMASVLKGEFLVVYVDPSEGARKPAGSGDERRLEDTLGFAEDLGANVVRLHGSVADQLLTYVRDNQIGHLFIGHPSHGRWSEFLRGSVTSQILRKLPDINVYVVADPAGPTARMARSPAAPHLAPESSDGIEAESAGRESPGPQPMEPMPGVESGTLRIFLGAAPGVGKTYTMLQEAHRLKNHGTDIVVGFIETHGRAHTAEQIRDLEVVPPLEIPYKGVVLREMDTKAVIARRPKVALVDELAHTNAPGSKYVKRYQDVFELMNHGIDVITTVNIQHAESLNDIVEGLTGVRVGETVPDWVLERAEQIELIDMAPEALIRRMVHGNVYPPEQARRALENFFTVANLSALRDLALRATAREVEDKLAGFMESIPLTAQAGGEEKVMVAVDYRPIGKKLIRSAWRLADALRADLVAVHVEPADGRRQAGSVEEERTLRANLQLAVELGATVVRLRGKVSEELIAYARAHQVGTLVLGHPSHTRLEELLHGSVTNDILRGIPQIDLFIVASPTR